LVTFSVWDAVPPVQIWAIPLLNDTEFRTGIAAPRRATTTRPSRTGSLAGSGRGVDGDDAHALVSDLHDRTTVRDIEYEDAVCLRVAVPRTASDQLRRRVSAVGGETKPLDDGE